MSTARLYKGILTRVATGIAVAVLAFSSLPFVADAQGVAPAGWPQGAPLVAGSLSETPLTAAELAYFESELTRARFAVPRLIDGAQDATGRAAITTAKSCVSPPCSGETWKGIRLTYIRLILLINGVSDNPLLPPSTPATVFDPPTTTPLPGTPTTPTTPGTTDTTGGGGGGEQPPNAVGGDPDDSCSLINGNLVTCAENVGAKIMATLLWVFVSLFGWLLGIVGMFFNWVMLVTVFQYAKYFGNSEGLLLAWSVLRDVGNIMLLFGFIFIGLQTILNIGHFSVGKALPRLVIFAVLINFSLFISGAVVDISNVFASSFYEYAGGDRCSPQATNEECVGYGISGKIMQASGVTGIFKAGGHFEDIWGSTDGTRMFVLYAGLSIFLLIMMVTLGAAAIMFVIRAITLMFLLVISPLGFAAMAIPQFEEQSTKWWKTLISQSFFAPIYLLLIFVGLKIMEGAQATFNAQGSANIIQALGNSNVSTGSVFILFALMIGFMIAAMNSAKSFGAIGASFAVNTSAKVVGGATFGVIGFTGRRTGGVLGGVAAKAIANNRQTVDKWVGGRNNTRLLFKAAKGLTTASWDPRTAGVQKAFKAATKKGLEVDFGAPNKTAAHGIHGIEEKAEKERVEFGKSLGLSNNQAKDLKAIKKLLEKQKEINQQELALFEEDRAAKLKPMQDDIKAQEEKARTAVGTPNEKLEQEKLGTMVRQYDGERQEFARAEKKLEQGHKDKIAVIEKDIETAGNAAKQAYAEDLEKKHVFYPPGSIGGHVDHTASAILLKDMKKSETDRLKDSLDAIKDKLNKPAPAPAAGGAPAADAHH